MVFRKVRKSQLVRLHCQVRCWRYPTVRATACHASQLARGSGPLRAASVFQKADIVASGSCCSL